jgi:hypothetical protein
MYRGPEIKTIRMPPNKYGNRININHPLIRPLYDQYKKDKKEIILSDAQRLEFENQIDLLIRCGEIIDQE